MKVLITGSSSGIGKATALKFLSSGHDVIGMDILPSSINHPSYTHLIHDVRDKDYPDLKGIEGFVHASGIFLGEEEVIETNLLGTIRLCEHLLSLGDIRYVCLIGSASARNGSEFPYYVASKGGLLSYGKNLALRLAKLGGVCNILSPGGVLTKSNDVILNDPKKKEAVLNETLLNKWASEEEIAEFAYFLVAINKSMTGEDLLVDNGEMLKSNFIW